MNLSKLTRMAQIAVDDHESGEPHAAAELRAFLLDHFDEVAEALVAGDDEARRAALRTNLAEMPLDKLPKAALETCRSKTIRKASKERAHAAELAAAQASADVLSTAAEWILVQDTRSGDSVRAVRVDLLSLLATCVTGAADELTFECPEIDGAISVDMRRMRDMRRVLEDMVDVEAWVFLHVERPQFCVRWTRRLELARIYNAKAKGPASPVTVERECRGGFNWLLTGAQKDASRITFRLPPAHAMQAANDTHGTAKVG